MNPQKQNTVLPKTVVVLSLVSMACLLLLHVLSPEFEPNWRMVSEYALGKYEIILSVFFLCWGFGSMLLAVSLWKNVTKLPARIGVIFLFISGIGAALAAYYDVSQPEGHGLAGTLGIPTVPIATLLIAYHLVKKENWKPYKKPLLWLSHATWISLVLMVLTMLVMISGFQNAGIEVGPDAEVPESLPEGVIGLVGYANRLLVVVDLFWLIYVANSLVKNNKMRDTI